MAERRGRPTKLPPPPDSQSERPTWTVTRRERTELSPLRSTSPFQSRTVTTTERVQILQMPITLTDEQVAPARLLALSPHGNTSQSVSSTRGLAPRRAASSGASIVWHPPTKLERGGERVLGLNLPVQREVSLHKSRQYQDLKQPLEEPPVFLSADNLERDQKPVGFSVSISARQPDDRTSSELFSSLSREPSSDKRYLRDQSTRTERSQKHRLSPHTWTTVRERTEVTYVRKLRVERSVSPRTRSPPRSSFIRRVPYNASATAAERTAERAYTCRSSNFDERVMVHHPIFPPHQSLYRNGGTYGNGDSRNGHTRTYSPVREVAAFDRTEWIEQHPSYIPPNRRADEIFTVGTPFIMGHVERDGNGCAYLRYQTSGLQERPPLPERLDDLPMIEEGAIECRRATIRATLRDMDTVGLVQDEEELERRRRPIRRVRQRMRNYCTML
ncbi:hypothetical protein Aduo_003716 [Ancylostoma duodenale]